MIHTILRPSDMHCHFRQDQMMTVVRYHDLYHCVLAMPNLTPPVVTGSQAVEYQQSLERLINSDTQIITTIKLLSSTTQEIIRDAVSFGVKAAKLYPEGVTTNSHDGVRDFESMYPVFEEMEKWEMILCIHGEDPKSFCLDREKSFLEIFVKIVEKFPRLKIVLEHITTREAVDCIKEIYEREKLFFRVAATITNHHLYLTLDDLVGGMLQPHNFCKPLAKRPEDKLALNDAAMSGLPCFFFGSDSAPHDLRTKECSSGCAGVFNPAEVALSSLAWLFDIQRKIPLLENFVSLFGPVFYGIELPKKRILLKQEEFTVVEKYLICDDVSVVPFFHGKKIPWSVETL